jgi:hypothetical protein
VDLTFFRKLMDVCCTWNCDPGKFTTKFSWHLAEPHFTYDSCRKTCCSTVLWTISTHQQPALDTMLDSCTVVWIILATTAVSAWRWVMQFLPGARRWQLRSTSLVCRYKHTCLRVFSTLIQKGLPGLSSPVACKGCHTIPVLFSYLPTKGCILVRYKHVLYFIENHNFSR